MAIRRWDVFCRVVDNFGDVGVCWRLACDLASRGEQVRLWIDDASALAWMAPHGAAGVSIVDWTGAGAGAGPDVEPGEVVIEAFGCDPPPAFVRRMAARSPAPCWINLEYLSAEAYVERSHLLPSPQSAGPGAGLAKRFFFPGFSAHSGGLIREPDLMRRRQRFDAAAWFASIGLQPRAGERLASLFCYRQPALAALLDAACDRPTLLLATAGQAAAQVEHLLGPSLQRGRLRAALLPRLSQTDYDHLLWSCDLNFVRGEDSFVRAQWASAPFVWQIYPQTDGADRPKLQAFVDRFLRGVDAGWADDLRRLWSDWNGIGETAGRLKLPQPIEPWRAHCEAWRRSLLQQDDLAVRLLRHVDETV